MPTKKKQPGQNSKGKEFGSGTVSAKRREQFKEKGKQSEDAISKGIYWKEYAGSNRKSKKLTAEEIQSLMEKKEEKEGGVDKTLPSSSQTPAKEEASVDKTLPGKGNGKSVVKTPVSKI